MDYKFKIVYKPGNLHRDADEISRHPVYSPQDFELTEMLTMLAIEDKVVEDLEATTTTLLEIDPPFDIRVEQNKDEKLSEIFNKLENIHVMANKAIKKLAEYTIIKGILYRIVKTRDGSKLVTVITKSMRKDILFTVHDDPMGG